MTTHERLVETRPLITCRVLLSITFCFYTFIQRIAVVFAEPFWCRDLSLVAGLLCISKKTSVVISAYFTTGLCAIPMQASMMASLTMSRPKDACRKNISDASLLVRNQCTRVTVSDDLTTKPSDTLLLVQLHLSHAKVRQNVFLTVSTSSRNRQHPKTHKTRYRRHRPVIYPSQPNTTAATDAYVIRQYKSFG